jgi:hypothetical protein
MPYIYCEACDAGCYTNVRSCPRCGAGVGRGHVRGQARRSRARAGVRVRDDVEIEVREALYGRRMGSVERVLGS